MDARSRYYVHLYIKDKAQYTYIQHRVGWAVTSPNYILGGATLFTIFPEGTVGLVVPLNFLSPGPSRESSPPGAHNMGELSQLSLAYRYTCPRNKKIKQ